jgi:hypothetical protein
MCVRRGGIFQAVGAGYGRVILSRTCGRHASPPLEGDMPDSSGGRLLGGASATLTDALDAWIGTRLNWLINQSGVSAYTCSFVKPSERMIEKYCHGSLNGRRTRSCLLVGQQTCRGQPRREHAASDGADYPAEKEKPSLLRLVGLKVDHVT